MGVIGVWNVVILLRLHVGEGGRNIREGGVAPGSLERSNFFQGSLVIVRETLEGQPKGMHRAFEPFEQVHGHERLNALLASGLPEVPVANLVTRIIQLLIFRQSARLHVAKRRIHGQREHAQPFEDLVETDDVLSVGELAVEGKRFQLLRESADVRGIVVGLDVAAGTRNRHAVRGALPLSRPAVDRR